MSRADDLPVPRPRLLVSVRDVAEARAALDGGADFVDVKEPARGALGRADDAVVQAIVRTVRAASPEVTTSAALGELAVDPHPLPVSPSSPDLVKIGLAGTAALPDWRGTLAAWRDGIADSIEGTHAIRPPRWVGVVYADWQAANAPPPREVVETTLELGCEGVLFDTFDKRSGRLLEVLPTANLLELEGLVHSRGRFLALAGRLRLADLPSLEAFRPDVVAVRSAACAGGDRNATVAESAVRRLRDALEGWGDSGDPFPAEAVLPDTVRG